MTHRAVIPVNLSLCLTSNILKPDIDVTPVPQNNKLMQHLNLLLISNYSRTELCSIHKCVAVYVRLICRYPSLMCAYVH